MEMDIGVVILLFVALAYMGLFFVHLMISTKKLDARMRNYYYGVMFFLVTFIACRIIFFINDTVITDLYGEDTPTYDTLYILGNFFANIASFGVLVVVEKYVYTKLKFVPSIIILIASIMTLVLPKVGDIWLTNYYSIVAAAMGVLIPFLYVTVALKITGKTRKKSLLLALGLIIFIFSVLTYIETLQEMVPILEYISPILLIIGLGIFHYGLLFYEAV